MCTNTLDLNNSLTVNSHLSHNTAQCVIFISILIVLTSYTAFFNISNNLNTCVMTWRFCVFSHEYTAPSNRSSVVRTSKADSFMVFAVRADMEEAGLKIITLLILIWTRVYAIHSMLTSPLCMLQDPNVCPPSHQDSGAQFTLR